MEQVKQPANVIGVANTVGLIGITMYFYKQNESLRQDVNTLAQQMASIAGRLNQLLKDDTSRQEIITKVRSDLQNVSSTIDEISQRHEDYDEDLEEVVRVLGEKNIPIERPSQSEPSPPPRRRHSSRRSKPEPLVRDRKPKPRPSRRASTKSLSSDEEDDVDSLIDTVRSARNRGN